MRFVVEVPHGDETPGEGGFESAERALRAAVASAGGDLTLVALRIVGEEEDLLYQVPVRRDFEAALAALPADVEAFRPDVDDGFRNWFRGRWTGMAEEWELTEEEIRGTTLTAERILALLDPPEHRDWRPVQHCVERWAKCADLVEAMDLATTVIHRRRLAYLFTHRRRPCAAALPRLAAWLDDPDPQVAADAEDALWRRGQRAAPGDSPSRTDTQGE